MDDLSIAFVKRKYKGKSSLSFDAALANALYKEILLGCSIALWQPNGRNLNVQTIRLAASRAFKVDMIVMMY